MSQLHEVLPQFQPLLSLHLLNGHKYRICSRHFLFWGKQLRRIREDNFLLQFSETINREIQDQLDEDI